MRALRLVAFECDDEINSGQHIRWGAAVFISQKQSTANRYFVAVPLDWREVLGWIPWPGIGGRHFWPRQSHFPRGSGKTKKLFSILLGVFCSHPPSCHAAGGQREMRAWGPALAGGWGVRKYRASRRRVSLHNSLGALLKLDLALDLPLATEA
jgi:hypothetical protein